MRLFQKFSHGELSVAGEVWPLSSSPDSPVTSYRIVLWSHPGGTMTMRIPAFIGRLLGWMQSA